MGDWGAFHRPFLALMAKPFSRGGARHRREADVHTRAGAEGGPWVRGVPEGDAGVARGCLCAGGTPPWCQTQLPAVGGRPGRARKEGDRRRPLLPEHWAMSQDRRSGTPVAPWT